MTWWYYKINDYGWYQIWQQEQHWERCLFSHRRIHLGRVINRTYGLSCFLYQYTARALGWTTWNCQYSMVLTYKNGNFIWFNLRLWGKLEVLTQGSKYHLRDIIKPWRNETYNWNLVSGGAHCKEERCPWEWEVVLCCAHRYPQTWGQSPLQSFGEVERRKDQE